MLAFRYPDKPIECGPEFLEGIRETEWVAQGKYDGWRAEVYTDANQTPTVFSRVGKPLLETNANVPAALLNELAKVCKGIPPLSVLDAEFVGPRGGHDPRLFVFDVLAWDDLWLVKRTFQQRREMLLGIRGIGLSSCPHSHILHAETVESDFGAYFHRLRQLWYDGGCEKLDLHEGIVLKRLTGKLTLDLNNSVKSRHMYKLKYRDVLSPKY